MSPTEHESHKTAFDRIQEIAAVADGYFARGQLPQKLKYAIQYHERQGRIERVERGIYRLTRFPLSDDEQYIVASLWYDGRGVISEESALAVHQLSDVLPIATVVTVEGETGQTPPAGVRLVTRPTPYPEGATTRHGAFRITTPWQTLVDLAVRGMDPGLFAQAVEQALERRLVPRDAWRKLALAAVDR